MYPMKKTIFCAISFCLVFAACFFLLNTRIDVKHDQKAHLKIENPVEKRQAVPVLDAINERNGAIRSLVCEDLRVVAQMPGKRPARLNGSIAYEKERKFRLELSSLLGSELDIGSNGDLFWFWSRRMKEPGLYWAHYSNFNKTKLKTPFNPFWLSHCMGIDKINYKDADIDSTGSKWRIIKKTVNAHNQTVTAVIYVDPQKKLVVGHGMYDDKGALVASTEVESFENGLPSKMTFIWHKEDASMIWQLDKVKSNIGINPSRWTMPNKTPKIDMSRE